MACGILVPQPGFEPAPPALEAQSLNHWTAREVPRSKGLPAVWASFNPVKLTHKIDHQRERKESQCLMPTRRLPASTGQSAVCVCVSC